MKRLFFIFVMFFSCTPWFSYNKQALPELETIEVSVRQHLEIEVVSCIDYQPVEKFYQIRSGDFLYSVFGHPATDAMKVKSNRIYPGQKFSFNIIDAASLTDIKFLWDEIDSDTLMLVIRDINEAYLIIRGDEFAPDVVIWSSRVSTGRAGKITPKGIFKVGRKNKWARSITYDAPMNYGHQLFRDDKPTAYWIHEGYVTGRGASNGCVRIPKAWAIGLWELSNVGLRVSIVDSWEIFDIEEKVFVSGQ